MDYTKGSTPSFRQRVNEFWNEFLKEEASIKQLMADKVDADTLIGALNKIIEKAFNDVAFEVGHNGQKHELILSPNGNKTVLKQIQYLLKYKPEGVDDRWNFYGAKPAIGSEGMGLSIYGKNITPDDFTVYTELEEDRKLIHIEVYAPKLDDLDEDLRYNALFIMLDLFIGELYTMEYIGSVDIIEVEKRSDHESIPLSKMHAYINYLIEEHDWDKTKDLSAQYTAYQVTPKEDSNNLRDDVFIGFSSAFDIIRQLSDEEIHPLDNIQQDGVYMGYIYYNNNDVDEKNMVPQRAEIEDKIMDLTSSQGIADSTGGATGHQHSYIDFIIYDLDRFLEIAKEVMDEYSFEPKGFALFNDKDFRISF